LNQNVGSPMDERAIMSDEKPKKTSRSARSTKKRASAEAAPSPVEGRNPEEPALPVPQASELGRSASVDIHAEIRRRAYEIYLSRGGIDGDDLSDWLEAERLVTLSRRADRSQR